MSRRVTLRAAMAAIAAASVLLAAYQAGRRSVPRPVMVWVTRSGTRYHREGCRYLRGSAVAVALDQVGGNYRACSKCGAP